MRCRVQGGRYVFDGAGVELIDAHNGQPIPLALTDHCFSTGTLRRQVQRLVKYRLRGYNI